MSEINHPLPQLMLLLKTKDHKATAWVHRLNASKRKSNLYYRSHYKYNRRHSTGANAGVSVWLLKTAHTV